VNVELIGQTREGSVAAYTLASERLRVRVLNYGGIIQSIETPDRAGAWATVTLGFEGFEQYLKNPAYFGALIGRYANRIAHGRFTLDRDNYQVPVNNGPNSLHGGPHGFHTRLWSVRQVGDAALTLSRVSPDGEEGYPGNLSVEVSCSLVESDALRLEYVATTDAATVLNLTNHAYFHLSGESGRDVNNHVVWLNASHFTPVDANLIPTGEIAPVAGTPFDFREPTRIGARIREPHPQLQYAGGYDHNWAFDGWQPSTAAPLLQARVTDPSSGRILEMWTTEPGVQFYTGNQLDGTLLGPRGHPYTRGAGFTLETQHFPDSPNQPSFPSTVLRPGEEYRSTTVYRFTVR
jgi:aldose 1-epimerase